MGLGDALHDGQPEAGALVAGADPFGAAPERLGQRRDERRRQRGAGVLHRQDDAVGPDGGVHLHGAVRGQVVHHGVVHQVRGELQQQRARADGGRDLPGGLDRHTVLLGQREQGLGRLLGQQRQVDRLPGEGPLVAAAEQEQGLGQLDRPGVDRAQALVQHAVVAVGVVAGDVEQGLRDRQRGAQLVRGVGGEPLLLGDVGLQPGQHRVEAVGQLAELVVAAFQPDPVGQRAAVAARGRPR